MSWIVKVNIMLPYLPTTWKKKEKIHRRLCFISPLVQYGIAHNFHSNAVSVHFTHSKWTFGDTKEKTNRNITKFHWNIKPNFINNPSFYYTYLFWPAIHHGLNSSCLLHFLVLILRLGSELCLRMIQLCCQKYCQTSIQ